MKGLKVNVRREALYLAIMAMEVCWVRAWILFGAVIYDHADRSLSWGALFSLFVVALYATRILARRQEDLRRLRVSIALAALVTIPLVAQADLYPEIPLWNPAWVGRFLAGIVHLAPAELTALLAGLYLWWRGIALTQGLGLQGTGFRFRLGIMAFVWLLLISTVITRLDITPLIFTYFAFSLLAMALARIEEVSRVRGGLPSPFNLSWLLTLVGATALVLLLGLGVTRLFSVEVARSAIVRLEPLAAVLDRLLYRLVVLIARLLEPLIIWLINFFRELWVAMQEDQQTEVVTPVPIEELFKEVEPIQWPAWLSYLVTVLRWGVIGLLAAAAFWIVVRSFRRWQELVEGTAPQSRESVWSGEVFREDLASLLRDGWQRLRGLASLRVGPGYSTASIRKIYASLLRLGAAMGYPRPEGTTPYEYVTTLGQALPGREGEVAAITEAYVQVRYGEAPTTEEDLRRVREWWERVREKIDK
jgi:hypothetical protein